MNVVSTEIHSGVSLPYGKGEQLASLPDGWALDLVAPLGPADLPDPERVLNEVLLQPLGTPPLEERLSGTQRVLLVLADATRKDGKRELLAWLLRFLAERGLGPERVDLAFALGTHRKMGDAELQEAVGADVLKHHAHFQHDCDGPVLEVGRTSKGTPVAFNARLWDYDLLVPVGGVVHHYFAGFGGGPKLLCPGMAARATIQKTHELVFRPVAQGGGRRPGVEPGRLTGNAVYEDFVEAVKMIDRPYFLVAAIRGSAAGRFAGFWAGSLFRAHQAAARAYLGWKSFPVDTPYDLVLSASGGHPLDANLIQAHKGLVGACRLAKAGGTIVHLAACQDGLGAPGLERWLDMRGVAEMEAELRREYFIYGQTLVAIREKSAAARILFVSGLPDDVVRRLGMIPARSLEEALSQVLPGLPAGHTTALFPDAAGMLPVPRAVAQSLHL